MSEDTHKPKKHWIEPASAILMAIITLATTWCSFQSAKWNGQSGDLASQSNLLDDKANLFVLEGMQVQSAQSNVFLGFVDAKVSGNDVLARFYSDRIGGELKPAFDAWLAQNPFEDAKAPPHPFTPEVYKPRFAAEAAAAREESAHANREAGRTGGIASGYLSKTVMLAAALFFVGTATRFDSRRVRKYSFFFGSAIFIYVAVRLISLPVAT